MSIRPSPSGKFHRLADGIHDLALGNGSRFDILIQRDPNYFLVFGVFGHGLWKFYNAPHPSYLFEKLKMSRQDCDNIADFLRDQFDGNTPSFGYYDAQLCSQPEPTTPCS